MLLKCKKNKFWIEHITNLFCEFTLLPLDGMSLAEQMNALSRLVIIIFLVLLLLGVRFSILFLLLSLLFIIILYYIQKNNMERFKAEHYIPSHNSVKKIYSNNEARITYDSRNSRRFCNDEKSLDNTFNNPEWMSENQKLVGQANPKTKIQPVIVPPIADLDYWRGTNLVTHPQINQQSNIDLYRSGYHVSSNCENSNKEKDK